MNLAAQIRLAPRYPITSFVALAATIISLCWWSGRGIEWFTLSPSSLLGRPWGLVTSALPHVDPIHLLFDLYWWCVFGSRIERVWGSLRLACVTVLLAASSAMAQYAVADAGVGLSGVGYGLVTMLFHLQRHDPRFGGAVSSRTVQLFAAWFVLCIVLTYTRVWQVGNVAHAAGAIVGWMVGGCVGASANHRRAWAAGTAVLVGMFLVGATYARSWVNVLGSTELSAYLGYEALTAGRPEEAVRLLRRAVRQEPTNGANWATLGAAYFELGRPDDAVNACKNAISNHAPNKAELESWLTDFEASKAIQSVPQE